MNLKLTSLTIFSCLLLFTANVQAVLTNLVVNGEFEERVNTGNLTRSETTVTYAPLTDPGIGSQWSTADNNDFDVYRQGINGAPALGTDGNATGQHLQIRGRRSDGVITLTITLPTNVAIGSNATLNFDSWSRTGGGGSLTGGRYTITVNGASVTGGATNATITNVSNAWTANTNTFAVAASDTVVVSWSDVGGGNAGRGLRIDEVELIADLVVAAIPEPSTVGVIFLGALMVTSSMRRRRQAQD